LLVAMEKLENWFGPSKCCKKIATEE